MTARVSLVLCAMLLSTASVPALQEPDDLLSEMAARALSRLEGELRLAGLREPVEVLRDRWGVAHIYARNTDDLFFAQGFVAAQDRLWQMEWWRRLGEGRLSEVLGPAALAHDRFARLLRYRGNMNAELTSYHPEGERIMAAFTSGVNAYIDQLGDELPLEFELTGIEPQHWSAEVPLLRMAGLAMTGNNLAELDLARRVQELGVEEANRRDAPDPWDALAVPEQLGSWRIPDDFRAQITGPQLPAPSLLPRFQWLRRVAAAAIAGPRGGVAGRAPGDGSNNWVVDGRLSATGSPLLANDPHRTIALPSLRYLVHLNAPGWNVIGSGEPALPGVAIGHNERIGWGLTIVGIDQGDIVVERLNPENPHQVWHRGGWEDLEVVAETIPVLGEEPRRVELKFSHHGPLIWEDPGGGEAWAFRTVLTEPGTAGYLGSLRVDQAQSWEEYLDALRAWKVPSENMIYADVDGNIGWLAAGLTPRREGWNGRLPVPGDGTREWEGFRDTLELPHESNPERGFIATANHNIMPPGYDPPLGYDWSSPRRYERIAEVLSSGRDFTIEDFRQLQYEVFSATAWSRIQRLAAWTFDDEAAEAARQRLAGWDAVLSASSPAAALYKFWETAVQRLDRDGPGPDGVDREGAQAAMVAALEALEREQGPDPQDWRWGRSNRMEMSHPLALDELGLGVVERSGDGTTVNVGGPRSGASFREILDFADWDRSLATSTPGQSGQPGSPHYDDLLPMWQRGDYFPLSYTRPAVEANAAHRLLLVPAPQAVR